MDVLRRLELLKILILGLIITTGCKFSGEKEEGLKDALKNKFYIGVAVNDNIVNGKDSLAVKIILKHFSSIVAENCMKMEPIHPAKDSFNFEQADAFVAFGEKYNLHIIGHCLVWHSQAPEWIFIDDKGKDVCKDTLINRMRNHIYTVVKRYKGKVKGWDVVNEAIEDNGEYRKSKWFTIIGPEWIELAFRFAHEADSSAELYYNDYNEWFPAKREAIYKLVKGLKEKGIRIDGIGMQAHLNMETPSYEEYEEAIVRYASLGVKVMITELDMTMLPWPSRLITADVNYRAQYLDSLNPYPNGLPDSVYQSQTERLTTFFKIFLKHSDKIDRVTIWGVCDRQSWRNYWPIPNRTDYPVLFDRNYQPKLIVDRIIEMAENN